MEEQKEVKIESGPNIELLYETLVRVIERKLGVKIDYKVRKKTEEELNSEKFRDRVFIFSDEVIK